MPNHISNHVQFKKSVDDYEADDDYEIMPGTDPWVMPMIYGGSLIPATLSVKVYELTTGNYAYTLYRDGEMTNGVVF